MSYHSAVNGGNWCRECYKDERTKECINHAKNKKGEFLSTAYVNRDAKLKWKCDNEDHEPWEATYDGVVRVGTWCPECGKENKSEDKIRKIFEIVFDKPFPSIRPEWNRNPKTGRKLELDGYNEDLGIAFEHHGPQHYDDKEGKRIFKSKDEAYIARQIEKDGVKRIHCNDRNIVLVEIPWNKYFWKSTKENAKEALDHIYVCCVDAGLELPRPSFSKLKLMYKTMMQ